MPITPMQTRIIRTLFIPLFIWTITFPLMADRPPGYNEALRMYREGQYEKSLEIIRSIFKGNEKSYALRMLAAADYAKIGNVSNAVAHLNYIQKDYPRKPDSHLMEAGVYRKAGNYSAALRATRTGLHHNPQSIDLMLEQARIFYETNQIARARRILDAILEKDANSFRAIYLDGLLYMKEKRYDAAEFRFRQAEEVAKNRNRFRADLYNNLGYAQELRGEQFRDTGDVKTYKDYLQSSLKSYQKALEVKPSHLIAQGNLSRLKQKLDHSKKES